MYSLIYYSVKEGKKWFNPEAPAVRFGKRKHGKPGLERFVTFTTKPNSSSHSRSLTQLYLLGYQNLWLQFECHRSILEMFQGDLPADLSFHAASGADLRPTSQLVANFSSQAWK